jgi:hypothetical protein
MNIKGTRSNICVYTQIFKHAVQNEWGCFGSAWVKAVKVQEEMWSTLKCGIDMKGLKVSMLGLRSSQKEVPGSRAWLQGFFRRTQIKCNFPNRSTRSKSAQSKKQE